MSGFVSVPDSGIASEFLQADANETIQLAEAELAQVAFGSWWPAILLVDARSALRLGSVVTDLRLRDALRAGGIAVLRDLAAWKALRVADGVDRLIDLPGDEIDGRPIHALHFERAVTNHAAALLSETHRDVSATERGGAQADDKALAADDYRRIALHAIRDLLGVGRTAVELI